MFSSSVKSKIKAFFLEWVDPLTMHGLPNIFRTKYLSIKVLWTLAFILANGACFYFIVKSVLEYLEYNVVTKIRVLEKDSVQFPAVTICNANQFLTSSAINFSTSLLAENNITDIANSTFLSQNFHSPSYQLYLSYIMGRYYVSTNAKSRLISDERKKQFGLSLNEMIISCFYSTVDCKESDWVWFYDTFHGNCFRFNTGVNSNNERIDIKNTTQSGKYNGLVLELFVGVPDDQKSFSIYTGAHIFINDNSIKPYSAEGLDISPGTQTNIVLERVETKLKSQPYSECLENLDTIDSFDSEYYRKVFRSNLTYRQVDCFSAYIQEEVFKKCNCEDILFNLIDKDRKPCSTIQDIQCAFVIFSTLSQTNYKKTIKDKCPLECNTVRYNLIKSEGRYPSPVYAKDLKNNPRIVRMYNNRTNITLEELRENTLAINIYYEKLKQTEIEENESMSTEILISGIGGTFGLFLGISLLSFFEFVELLVSIICIFLNKNFKVNSEK
ncbi:unnamed protein product [Brachionus calyciflorus]|uniref:Uncharacterized protein n=1 Tax=Brachionus calyciflorus TaxID=104777 RepID=A0A814A2U9_9BILA|nr:unnamed protein product [Brachionus calyciflorus]